jgi:hypothetical protein
LSNLNRVFLSVSAPLLVGDRDEDLRVLYGVGREPLDYDSAAGGSVERLAFEVRLDERLQAPLVVRQ